MKQITIFAMLLMLLAITGCGSALKLLNQDLQDKIAYHEGTIDSLKCDIEELLIELGIITAANDSLEGAVLTVQRSGMAVIEDLRIKGVRTIHFDFDSYALNKRAETNLKYDGWQLGQLQGKNLVITGYTDEIGDYQYNLKLGELRAEMVRRYLVGYGISHDRITVRSMGEKAPYDPDRHALNRRVEITVE